MAQRHNDDFKHSFIHGAITGGVSQKRIHLALLHMIPLLLCASHIAKSLLYFSVRKGLRGFHSTSEVAVDAAFIGKDLLAEQASTII